jgi:DNA polymerase
MNTVDEIAKQIINHHDDECDFPLCRNAKRFVPGEGDPNADVMFIGEAPGAQEEKQGRPFCGPAGKLLDSLIETAGLLRSDVFITNVVKARPPQNRDPTSEEILHHRYWLEKQIYYIRPKIIVPLGRYALRHFIADIPIGDAHGVQFIMAGYHYDRIFPMYHPSAALHDGRLRETLFKDAEALGDALGRLVRA